MAVALKPRLRGVFHEYSFFISLVSGVVLVLASSADAARVASAVYSASLAGLFGVSALYHRVTWQPRARRWMRRLDHSMIYLLIAGTYTPMTLLVMSPQTGALVLRLVWSAALAGIVLNMAWITAPRWVSVTVYGLLAWAGAGVVPELLPSVSAEKLAAPAVNVFDTARLRTVRAPFASTPSDSVCPFSVNASGGLVPFGFEAPSERLFSVRF